MLLGMRNLKIAMFLGENSFVKPFFNNEMKYNIFFFFPWVSELKQTLLQKTYIHMSKNEIYML